MGCYEPDDEIASCNKWSLRGLLDTARLRRNFWKPARIEGLLAYGVKNPNEQRQYPIVGLGSFAGVLGSRYVPYLYGRGAGRGLDLL
jgi:hypothetical protein